MSVAVISYRSLGKAIGEAKDVAKKFDKYQDSLYDNVYKKLNNYGGPDSSSLCSARGQAHEKIEELKDLRDRHYRLETDLKDMKDACKRVDTAVKSKVSSLTSTFRENHGIRNSKIENAVNYLGTKFANNTKLGRWMNKKNDELRSNVDYHKDCIKTWYNYQGGKEILEKTVKFVLDTAIAALAIAGACCSAGVLAGVAAGLLGVISLFNAFKNYEYELKAYKANQDGDPARAQRLSAIDSWQDHWRSSFIFDDSGEIYRYKKQYHMQAKAMDVVKTVCTVITFTNSASKFVKNGYKWITGSNAELSQISWKNVFSRQTGELLEQRFFELGKSIKDSGWQAVKQLGGQVFDQIKGGFKRNMNDHFWKFTNDKGVPSFKATVETVKNVLSVPADFLENHSFIKTEFNNVVLPALTLFSVNSTDGTLIVEDSGQLKFDFTENITFDDFKGIFEKAGKIHEGFSNIFDQSDGQKIELDVLKKINKPGSINMPTYGNSFPIVELPVFRMA